MSGQYLPAGFESFKRKDYFESDDDDDDLNDIVYPNPKPAIKVISPPNESESGVQVSSSSSSSEKNAILDGEQSKASTEEELQDCVRFNREYSVNRYDPNDEDNGGYDDKENAQQVKDENNSQTIYNWFNDDVQPCSSNSLSPDLVRNRETRSPSPGMLIMEDIRLATHNGDLDYIKHQMSIDHGFFIDTVLKNGWTILMLAADFGFSHIVQYCLEQNADPNFHYDGFTSLMAACQSFYADEDKALLIVELLLKAGAFIDSKDLSGKTALMYACETGKCEVALYLAGQGADVTLKDNKQWTCLHFAATKGFGPVVRNMMDCGAKLNTYNNFGQSPSDLALESGFHELGILLTKLKADEPVSIEEEAILMKPKASELSFKTEKRHYLTDIEHFFGSIGLPHLVKFFEKHKINYSDLMSFNECDLDALPINEYGAKLKIWEGIKRNQKKNWIPSRVSSLKRKSQLNCIEFHVLLMNISNQLRFMNTTFQYLRNHLKNDPDLIWRRADKTNVHKLYEQARMTLDDGGSSLTTLESLVQDIDNLSVTVNGLDKNKKQNQYNGKSNGRKFQEEKDEIKPKIQLIPLHPTTKSVAYQKAALFITGLLGISALVYFRKDSIASFLPKK